VVGHQPADAREEAEATRAMLSCPTASIGVSGRKPAHAGLLPLLISDEVYYCGYNSEESYGGNAFVVRRPGGNFMVDAPRWVPELVRTFERWGGLSLILLSHRDDVADAERYAEHFGTRVLIHRADRAAAPFAEPLDGDVVLRPGLEALFTPGHTRGSMMFLLEERFLFSGDSLAFSRARRDLTAFHDACWYSWPVQASSLERLLEKRFEWVLAGHGDRIHFSVEEMHERLRALVARMRGTASGVGAPLIDD
jgi:glyoxylase-like metal-dependent hydrolase (beta-lactamase superfamily II)